MNGIKKLRMFIATISLLALTCVRGEANTLEVAGEYLYFQPILDNVFYAIPRDLQADLRGTSFSDHYDFSSGCRVEGIYHYHQASARFRWSSLHSSHSESVFGIFVDPVNYPPLLVPPIDVTATSSLTLNYTAYDLFFGWDLCNQACMEAVLSIGVNYIRVSQAQNGHYAGILDDAPFSYNTLWSNKVEGIGPELAILGAYHWPRVICSLGLEFVGSLQVGSLVVRNNNNRDNLIRLPPGALGNVNPVNESIYRVVPFWDLRLGIGTEGRIGCVNMDILIGYEVLVYYNLLNRTFASQLFFNAPTFDFYSDLAFHGLFVRLGVGF